MKLNRRKFLKAAVAAAAGTALARVAGTGEDKISTTPYEPGATDWTTPSRELLDDVHPDFQMVQQMPGVFTVGVSPGHEIKAMDMLTADALGFVRPALIGDWRVGVAVADAVDGTVMIYVDPKMAFYV